MSAMQRNRVIVVTLLVIAFDFMLWHQILFANELQDPELYFLDVGQGDSTLVMLPGAIKILIDGGPSGSRLIDELERILPVNDRFIDLLVMSHPQTDHFKGFMEVLQRYEVGAFVWSGERATAKTYQEFEALLKEKRVPMITLGAGDAISYKGDTFAVIGPDRKLLDEPELNDGSLVLRATIEGVRALFTGDIGFTAEQYIATRYRITADILKVPHHGSKYSSSNSFLAAIAPKISVIEVGKNSYGHPTYESIQRLEAAGSSVLRTDRDGTVRITIQDGKVSVAKKLDQYRGRRY